MYEKEEWRAVIGFEGLYEVSSHGRVRSLDRKGKHGGLGRHGKVLKPAYDKGYPFVNLSGGGTKKVIRVHVLVSRAFLGERPEGCEVGHIDHNRSNCRVDNLEYVTHAENMRHAARYARMGKMSTEQVQVVRAVLADDPKTNLDLLAETTGITKAMIRRIANCTAYKHVPNADGSIPIPIATRDTLTVEKITSLQALGMTLPQIAKLYDVDYSTPYQALRRAGIWQDNNLSKPGIGRRASK